MKSPLFQPDSSEEAPWRLAFTELITLVYGVLRQAQLAGNRVDFQQGIGVGGKVQDITSLVEWLHLQLPGLASEKPGQLAANRLNRYFNQGTGYFANGSFFTGEYDREVAFFVDDQRIYLHQQIGRAVRQAEGVFSTLTRPSDSPLPV